MKLQLALIIVTSIWLHKASWSIYTPNPEDIASKVLLFYYKASLMLINDRIDIILMLAVSEVGMLNYI